MLTHYFTIITYLAILNINVANNFQTRITGGSPVKIEDYPYQVSIIYIDFHICGGSLISEKHVLTAAHCTLNINEKDLSVRAGSSIINEDGVVINVNKKYEHPDYDIATDCDSDIAVLELVNSFEFSNTISKILLPLNYSEIPDGTYGDITGWGFLSFDGFLPTQLQQVSVPTVSIKDCRTVYGETKITDRMICAGYFEGGKDSCKGDSGGPFSINGEVFGIISCGDRCGEPNTPGVYTKVSYFKNFVDSVIESSN